MKQNKRKLIYASFLFILSIIACNLFETLPEKLKSTHVAMQTELASGEPGIVMTPMLPEQRAHFTLVGQLGGSAYAVAVDRNIVWLGQGPRLIALDVSQPDAPRLVGMSPVLPGVVYGVQITDGYAYVTTEYSNLHIFDVHDPTRPAPVSSLQSKPGGCHSIAVQKHFAYLACLSGLLIVDIANPQQPRVLSAGQIKGTFISIAVMDSFAYLVDITNYGLVAVNISDPTNPQQVGFFSAREIPNSVSSLGISAAFFAVRVCGNRLCLAAGQDGLVILNVSNPAQPAFAGRWDTSAASGLVANGNIVYLVDDMDGIYMLDVSTPERPSQISILPTQIGTFEFSVQERSERGVAVQGNMVFVTDQTYGLTLIDFRSGMPQRIGHYQTPVPDLLIAINVAGNYAYVVGRHSGFRVVDISDPSAPFEVYYDDARKNGYTQEPTGLVVKENYAYISDSNYPLHIYNISNPKNSAEVSAVYDPDSSDGASDIVVYGKVAYLSGSGGPDAFYPGNGIWVVEISNPAQPQAVNFVDLPNSHWHLALYDHYLYALDGTIDDKQAEPLSLHILDLTDPLRPVEVTKIPISEFRPLAAANILTDNKGFLYLLICSGPPLLKIYNLANPIQPVEVATHTSMGAGYPALEKEGEMLLLSPLIAYNLSDPKKPIFAGGSRGMWEAWDIDMVGDLVFVATSFQGLYIFRYTP